MGAFMRMINGRPVRRDSSEGVVAQMAQAQLSMQHAHAALAEMTQRATTTTALAGMPSSASVIAVRETGAHLNMQPMIAINYESVVRSCYLFARVMKAAGRGQIVNISSIGANITAAGTGIYGGLKKALEMFTDSLRIELAGSGVKVGLVAPGTTSTDIFEPMKAEGKPAWDTYIPALEPDDIARAVLYILEQPPRANAARVAVYSSHEGF